MKRLFALFLLPALGCATSGDGLDLGGVPQTRTVTAGSASPSGSQMGIGRLSVSYVDEPLLVESTVEGTAETAWPALLEAFREEGLTPDGLDEQTHVVSVSRVEWSGERRGMPLSTFVDCGLSSTGLALADHARVAAALTAQVASDGPETARVVVRMDAVAFPLAEAGERARGCTTTRGLEEAIIGHVQRALEPDVPPPGPSTTSGSSEAVEAAVVHPEAYSDLPFGPGDKIRVWVSSSERWTGAFLGFQADSLLLKRSRRTGVPLGIIQQIQVKETRRRPIVIGAVLGMAAGVTIATATDLGIGGRHAVQGEILNPGLGVVVGGLVGAVVGSVAFGTSWIDVRRFW